MRYRLYMYATRAADAEVPAISVINCAVSADSDREWRDSWATKHMKDFDAAEVKAQIDCALQGKCRVIVKYPPEGCEQTPFLYIVTSYAAVRDVLPCLHKFAAERELAIYDAETDVCFYRDLLDRAFLAAKTRGQQIKLRILGEAQPVWKFEQIMSSMDDQQKVGAFAVTLKKVPDLSFLERTRQFHDILKNSLIEGETLQYADRCFTVSGQDYQLQYCLEGYKKHPCMIGFYENDQPRTDLIRRMGCTEAIKVVQQRFSVTGRSDIEKRMDFYEMKSRYPNPADRYVRSLNISKRLAKETFEVRYSSFGYYSSEILFHILPDPVYQNQRHISVLKIEEDSATFILPFVADIYPYFGKRYYLTENHLPVEMWKEIVERLSEAKEMILHDAFSPALRPYIEEFDLYVLADRTDENAYRLIREAPAEFAYQHRYRIAHLYDIFIEWANLQTRFCGPKGMFNLQGP